MTSCLPSGPAATLPGPSRTITVEPIELPEREVDPEPLRETPSEPASPERAPAEPPKEPARASAR